MTIWLHHPLGRVGFAPTLQKEDGVWVANCAALDIASQGSDPEDAVEMLKEALELVMEHCLEKNTWMTVS